jgi:hypothetical protein
VVTLRAAELLRDTLREAGGRFFLPPWGTTWKTRVVGLVLDARTDWAQVTELLGEAHHLFTPGPRRARPR